MAMPNSRETAKKYCLRQLGWPVVEVNVDEDQLQDRIDEALSYYRKFHYDGTEKLYLKHQVTATDIVNKYVETADAVQGISRVFPLNETGTNSGLFDIRYQMRIHDLQTLTANSYRYYAMSQQHLATINQLLIGLPAIRWNRHTNKLYIDVEWGTDIQEGEYLIIEAMVTVDPDVYTDVWSDTTLLELITALFKQQWGANMKKFSNIRLPGGIVMNGQEIYDEAKEEISAIKDDIRSKYQEPVPFLVG